MRTKIATIVKQVIIPFALLIVIFFSCKKREDCKTCSTKMSASINLTLMNQIQTLNYPNTSIYNSEDGMMQAGVIIIPSSTYNKFNILINELTGSTEQTSQTVLYINKLLTPSDSISGNEISAISRISLKNNILFHSFYIRKDGLFIQNNILTTELPNITVGSIESLLTKIVFPGQRNFSYAIFSNSESPDYTPKNQVDVLRKKIKQYLNSTTLKTSNPSSQSNLLPENDAKCKTVLCREDFTMSECRLLLNGAYKCMGKLIIICRANYIKDILTEAQEMSTDSLNYIFDSSLHYGIKNNVLSNTTFGNKYKEYYHDLSIIYDTDNNLNVSLILNTARLLFAMNTNFGYLKNYATEGEMFFVNTDMKNRILALINQYKGVYNDAYTENIFQDIITDLNWAENKTISEIIPLFLNN